MFLYVCIVVLGNILSIEHKSSTNGAAIEHRVATPLATRPRYRPTSLPVTPTTGRSPVSVKLFPYLLIQDVGDVQLQGTRRLQPSDTPQHTHAGYAHGCHHTSLLVLATTRRHAICNFACDTCSPTEDHSCSSFTQSELNKLTQLSVLLQGRHGTSEDLQPYIPHIHPHSLSSDDHSAHPTNPALLTPHSRTREQPDSHYRITALIPYTVHLLSQVPADFVTHQHPSSFSLAGEYCSGTRDPQYDSPHTYIMH